MNQRKIVIDARSICQNLDGLGIYSIYFIERLYKEFRNKASFKIIISPSALNTKYISPLFFSERTIEVAKRDRFGYYDFDTGEWNEFISQLQPDIYISTAYFSTDYNCTKIVIIHDLIPLINSQLRLEKRQFYSKIISETIEICDLILTPSTFTYNDIKNHFKNISPELMVLYPDIRRSISRFSSNQLSDGNERFIMLGVKCPRKNVEIVIQALKILKSRNISTCKVYFIGKLRELDVPLESLLIENSVSDLADILGYIPDEELQRLICGCRGLLYTSLYEGFGIPMIEFLSCNKPVICIRNTSIEEVAGNCGFYINNNPIELADAMIHFSNIKSNINWQYEVIKHLDNLSTINDNQYSDLFKWIDLHL